MKVRIFKKPDGSLIINRPHARYQGGYYIGEGKDKIELTLNDCKIPEICKGLEFSVMDESEIPELGQDEYFEMFHFENGKVAVDKGWTKCVMPNFLVRHKLCTRKMKEMSEAKSFEEYHKAVIAYGELNTQDLKDDKFWAAKALEGLEFAEAPKPEVEAKLKAKVGQ